MLGHVARMVVDHLLEPLEIGVDGASVSAWPVKVGTMALGAAVCRDDQFLAMLGLSRQGSFPGTRRGNLGQAREVREEIRHVRIADLLLGERRHDAPRLADRLLELIEAQLTPGKVRSKATLALVAVAIP